MFKQYIRKKLEKYVREYLKAHPDIKLIVVVGSVGKTSTKRAVATLLSQRFTVRMYEGNHNTEMSVPLGILGIKYPENIRSIAAWLAVFAEARRRVSGPRDVDVIVQELGTDHPGDIAAFGAYLVPDIAIVTAITPEHMEFFGTIEAVAQEEMSASNFSKFVLLNHDDIDGRFADYESNPNFATYGLDGLADYRFEKQEFTIGVGYSGNIIAPEFPEAFAASVRVFGEHSIRPVMGAVAVSAKMGLLPHEIVAGISLIRPVPGRMNVLSGIGGTTIIDDSYNSSPAAAAAALQTLYLLGEAAPQRIAVLGDMRELGASSQMEHERLGMLCDPNMLAWVVTVGPETEKYLAPVARQRGCQVKSVRTAIEAGAFVRSVTREGAMILVKGSQNEIFLEETVKILCDMSEDIELVRQSEQWQNTKRAYFDQYK